MYNCKEEIKMPFYENDVNIVESNNDIAKKDEKNIKELKNNFDYALTISDELLVNVSHELKTPLNIIYSASQLMEISLTNDSTEKNNDKILKNIDSIKQNCYRLTRLINNIVDVSKIRSGSLKLNIKNEDIVEVTKDLVNSASEFIKEKKLNIFFNSNIERKVIPFDSEKIERVILNLISNAIKFSNAGGNIFVSVLDKDGIVEISVRDDGIGISEQYLENIFDRFGQVDKSLSRIAEGSGIGLYFAKSIIEIHGGKISAESKEGEGSIFKFELPAKKYYKVNNVDKIMHRNNRDEIVKIEFSDI